MQKITITLLHDNGQPFDTAEISYLFELPRLIQIDDKFYVQINGGTKYQHSYPKQYKTKK